MTLDQDHKRFHIPNLIFSETTGPIEVKFDMESLLDELMKFCSYSLGHMPYMVKTLQISSTPDL